MRLMFAIAVAICLIQAALLGFAAHRAAETAHPPTPTLLGSWECDQAGYTWEFAPDGKWTVYGEATPNIGRWSRTGDTLQLQNVAGPSIYNLSLSGDGKLLSLAEPGRPAFGLTFHRHP